MESSYTEGSLAVDTVTDETVFVVYVDSETTISEKIAQYDYNKNPISVYELEKTQNNREWKPNDTTITVVYPDVAKERLGTDTLTIESVQQAIKNNRLKAYHFPSERLE